MSARWIFPLTNRNPKSVAGAIAGFVRKNGRAEIKTIGAGSTNPEMNATVLASGYLKIVGFDFRFNQDLVIVKF